MDLGWAEINSALDDLIAHEEGVCFQRLAISLAKQRWPETIATEVHRDVGEDALAHPYLTEGGKQFDIACSITGEYNKIKTDAEKIFGRQTRLDFLAFYTPAKISNETVVKWQERFRQDFDSELIVITREDIIHELLKHENQWICRQFLKLPVAPSPDIDEVMAKGKTAASKIIEQWQRQTRYDPGCLIDLDAAMLDDKNTPTGRPVDPPAIAAYLADGDRVVLKGSPGAGKTTTLLQISEMLINDHQKVPLLISLPEWIDSGEDVITFFSKHPDFMAAGVSPSDVALLYKHGRLVFLFNGWNEIDPSLLAQAGRQLLRVDREFTAAGIIVASRENYVAPPLLGKFNLILQPLSNSQRRTYIAVATSESSDELIGTIETSRTLTAITRTPLFLSVIVQLYNSGAQIPDTRYGVLQCAIVHVAQSPEHSTALQTEPTSGRATQYLSAMAFEMTKSGRTAMHHDQALTVVNEVNKQLLANGQIGAMLDPGAIVDILCAHHLLEKSIYPVNSVHFTHQQFQEFYAATRLRDELAALCIHKYQNAIQAFQKDVINIPVWEEPLKLLAEEIGGLITTKSKLMPCEVDPLVAGRHLVEWTIPVDPVFAAELIRVFGEEVWKEVKDAFEPLLRAWYECTNEDHKKCALAAMLATGAYNFSNILWPLLESPDHQVRLSTYRTPAKLFLSCLGPKWKERVCKWDEERRAEFIKELSLCEQLDAFDVFEDFAENDPGARVRVTAINAIGWYGRRDKLWRILKDSDDETLKMVVRHKYLLRKIPDDLLPRVMAAYDQLLSQTKDPNEHLKILLHRSDFDESGTVALLKTELEKYAVKEGPDSGISILHEAVGKIASEDPDWASKWVAQRQAEGKLYQEHWSALIGTVPSEIIDGVIQELLQLECPENKALRVRDLIGRGASKKHAQSILWTLIEKHAQSVKPKGQTTKKELEVYWRLKNTARALSWQTLIEVLLEDYSQPSNNSQLRVILDLVGCAALERNTTRPEVTPDKLDEFRAMLRCYSKQVLAANDYGGGLKANLSCALGLFGEAEDIDLIRKLIYADIERIRQGQELYRQGIRTDARAQGAMTRWSLWHIRALCRLDPENADQQLLELLNEPEYEEDAGKGLVQLLKRNVPRDKVPWGHEPLVIGYALRKRDYIDLTKSKQYSAALEKRISDLLKEREKAEKEGLHTGRLWQLAAILASVGEPSVVPLALDVLRLPGEYGAWMRVGALEAIIRAGTVIETEVAESIIDQVIEQLAREGMYRDQNRFLLARCLAVLACTNDMTRAVAKIKQLASEHRLGYEMRSVIATLGDTNSSEAANYLIELAQNPTAYKMLAPELPCALTDIDTPEAKNAVLSMVDPTVDSPKLQLPVNHYPTEVAAKGIADWCRDDDQLKQRICELCEKELTEPQRAMLANIIHELSTPDVVSAGLNLISDKSSSPVPFLLREAIEKSVTEHVPSQDFPGSYHVKPRENITIRSKLFDIACDDDARRRSAFDLLGFILRLRLEYGKPPMEPRHPNINRSESWPPLDLPKPKK